MSTDPRIDTLDPRPYRDGGPFVLWQEATIRPTRVGQKIRTFGTADHPAVIGTVVEIDGKHLEVRRQGKGPEDTTGVCVSHAAVID
jgi:hypothetical protein